MKNFSGLLILPFALLLISAVLIITQIKVLIEIGAENE